MAKREAVDPRTTAPRDPSEMEWHCTELAFGQKAIPPLWEKWHSQLWSPFSQWSQEKTSPNPENDNQKQKKRS
jgi:hypothetical protein